MRVCFQAFNGGLDIAAEWAGFETVFQCEFADYPYKVLQKHWEDVPKERDIHNVTADSFYGATGIERPTVLSGGFPCQPHSLAGKRKASCDERDLWGEFARVICEIKPKWVVGENVVGLLSSENGRFFGRILRDLDEMGYNASWGVWGACDVGAVHRRERVFVVAYSDGESRFQANSEISPFGKNRKTRDNALRSDRGYEQYRYWQIHKPPVCGMAYGGGNRLYRDRMTALGNAVVPQQAYPIFKAIAKIERLELIK